MNLNGTVPSLATWMPSKRMMTSSGFRCLAASKMGCTERTSTPFWPPPMLYDFLRREPTRAVKGDSHEMETNEPYFGTCSPSCR